MRTVTKNCKRLGLLAAIYAIALLLGAAPASGAPVWQIDSVSNPTAAPGPGSQISYFVQIANTGDSILPPAVGGNSENCTPGAPPPAIAANCYEVTASFPDGIIPLEAEGTSSGGNSFWEGEGCAVAVADATITCSVSGSFQQIEPRRTQAVRFLAEVEPGTSGKTLTSTFQVSGGGAGSKGTADAVKIAPGVQFGVSDFDSRAADASGDLFTQAGGHPYDITTSLEFNSYDHPNFVKGTLWPAEPIRDIVTEIPPGLLANLTVVDQCTMDQLANGAGYTPKSLCPTSSQVGFVTFRVNQAVGELYIQQLPLFNMVPFSGSPAGFGFNAFGTMVFLDTKLRSESDYGVSVFARGISQGLPTQGSSVTFWGEPGAKSHDSDRACLGASQPWLGGPICSGGAAGKAFLRMPTACTAPGEGLEWKLAADSWFHPGSFDANGNPDLSDPAWDTASFKTHEAPGYPFSPTATDPAMRWGPERGIENCADVPVKGTLKAQPTSIDTETSSGLEVHVEVPNPGLENPTGIASSDLKKVKVALPQGLTINPSQAEGLGVCMPAQYESTVLSFHPTPGKGCPDDSKIGSVEVVTPLLEEHLNGDVFVAQQDDPGTTQQGAENPFDSLLAIYVVIKNPERGILVKLPGKVDLEDPAHPGQIVTTFDDLPQQPFSSFDFKFREGARAPLVTPPACGTYTTETEITGWSSVDPVTGAVDPANIVHSNSDFKIVRGIGGGPCPPGGVPPFKPGFSAGSIDNNAGAYSPFVMRLSRGDGEQDMTRFSAVLPPGVLGKLAGLGKCPDAAVAIAKGKTGRQELASPSCPANSEIGRTLVGAGVGSVLTRVPGKLYMGGPFHGDPLSVIAITPAVAGPFDVNTVVVREALTLNSKTAEVEVDGSASDPIPHILRGIPVKVRDLRVYVDRPQFTLNPTSCDPSSTKATLFGSFADVFSSADDAPIALSDRYQAANCAALGFKPNLRLRLKGGTRRGGHPGLTATYRPRPGDANAEGVTVRLPRSAFLDQAHIRTVCTRVQFAADACPKGAQYGYIRAWTPLLDEPLQGPVWLRSSDHKLPDLVFDLHGLVDVEVATRIDSIRGGVRARVDSIPDAPLSKVVLKMQGGKKGLIVNSRNLCAGRNRATAQFDGQNGKINDFNPALKSDCGSKGKR
jgi:hypothetical protein